MKDYLVLLRNFGLTETDAARIEKQTGEILDTLSKLSFRDERAKLAFRNRLLNAYQSRQDNEAKLAARLAELDTSRGGNIKRAVRYNNRRAELSRYKIYGAYIYPTNDRTPYRYDVIGPVFSFH